MRTFVIGSVLGVAIAAGACSSRTVSDDAWAIQLSEVEGYAQIEDVIVDKANNTYLAGYVTFAEPTRSLADIFLAKVDSAGEPTWLRSSGSPCGSDFGEALILNADGELFLAGRVALSSCGGKVASLGGTPLNGENDSVFLSRISASGDHERVSFATQAVDDHSGGRDLAVAEDHTILILGDYLGSPAIGERLPSARAVDEATFVARASPDGTLLSSQRLQLPGGPYCTVMASRIASGAEGTVFVTGRYREGTRLGTNACGLLPSNPNGTIKAFVARLTDSGSTRWVAAPTIENIVVTPHALVVDAQGRAYVTGEFSREKNSATAASSVRFGQHPLKPPAADRSMFIASLSAGGEFRWALGVDGAVGWGLALSLNGDLLVAGEFDGGDTFGPLQIDPAGGADAIVARVRPDGELVAAVSAGGREGDRAHAITVSHSGHIYVAGTFKGRARFATTELEGNGTSNFFLWKLSPDSF